MRCRLAVGLLLALGLPGRAAVALEPDRALTQYDLQSWARTQGLPQSTVGAVRHGSDGYLWVATQEGLLRFDGRRFVRLGPDEDAAFRSGFVTALAEGREGLWIGTFDGVVLKSGRSFRNHGAPEGLVHRYVRSLLVDRAGRLWAGTEGGLQRFSGGRFSTPLAPEPAAPFAALAEGVDGAVWAAAGARLYRIDAGGPPALGAPVRLPSGIRALCAAPGGGVLAGGSFGVLRVRSRESGPEPFPLPDAARPDVSALHIDAFGSLWVGTQAEGLLRFSGSRAEQLSTAQGLPSKSVVTIAEDADGSLWLGLDRGGLARLAAGSFRTFGALEGLPVESTFAVRGAPDGTMWLTSDLGLSRLDRSGRVETFGGQAPAGPGAFASALLLTPAGELYVGSFADGLFAGGPGSFRRVADASQLPSPRALLADASGAIWVGHLRGLSRVERGRVVPVAGVEGAVFALEPDGSGGLLAGTRHGLVALGAGGAARLYPLETGPQDRPVVSLCRDRKGRLWVGTIGAGLGRLDGERVRTVRARDGLPSDSVYAVVEDEGGALWTSSNQGVFRLAEAELESFLAGRAKRVVGELFGRTDGLRIPEGMGGVQPSAWRGADGRLWFSLLGGVAVVDPRHLPGRPRPPRVVVEELRVDGRPVALDRPVEAPPGSRRLEVTYAGLSLLAPERLQFRYRLTGLEAEWSDVGTRREAFFTNVPPGEYAFEVSARLGDGAWSSPAEAVPIAFRARFYETRGFLALSLVAALLAAAGAHRWRTTALTRRQRQLERVVDERTRDLRCANERLGELNVDLEEANRSLERLSQLDGLTGVANRRCFDERLGAEWRRAVRSGERVALAMLDVDHFKAFNDGYGHPAGDACLARVAQSVAEALHRPGDLVARYGGEEFVLLLPGLGPEAAREFVDGLRGRVEALAVPHAFSAAASHVTLSAGVATALPRDGGTPAALVAAADAALYAAKRSGRNRVVLA